MSYVIPVLEKKPERSKTLCVIWYDIRNKETNIKINNNFLYLLINDTKVLLNINSKEQTKILMHIEIKIFCLRIYWIKLVKIGNSTIAYSLSIVVLLLLNTKNNANKNKTEMNAPVEETEQPLKINR